MFAVGNRLAHLHDRCFVDGVAAQCQRRTAGEGRLCRRRAGVVVVVHTEEVVDRRQRVLALTDEGQALIASVDRDRADQFLAVVRPMPMAERALVAMGVAALADKFNLRG